MIDEKRFANGRAGMDIDTRLAMRRFCHHPGTNGISKR
jgi:hypothetical protein